jgi:predicted glycosyltransferase
LVVTSRDHAQTRELTLARWPEAIVVGGESPRSRGAKARSIGRRVAKLRKLLAPMEIDAAASLGSYAQLVAARSLRVPALTMMDYEHQPANHLSFRLARRVVVPRVFPTGLLRRCGASAKRVSRFDGFKEEFYLDEVDTVPDPIETQSGATRAVLRPPPEGALYHQQGNSLFDAVLRHAIERADIQPIVLPRMTDQRSRYSGMPGVHVPERTVDGLALLRSADVFVGAGGTMSREAALLGVRAYTMFAGRFAAVDAELIRRGLLYDLRGQDSTCIDWNPRTAREAEQARRQRHERGEELRGWLAARIEELAR